MSNENKIKALLKISFKATGIGLNIRDEAMEAELARNHQMDAKRVRTTKKILAGAIDPINSEVGKIRRFLKLNSFEGIGETRIMVAAESDRIRRQVAVRVSAAYDALDALIADWDNLIEIERRELNGSFDPTNYPSSGEALRSLFSFELQIEPMPDPHQFRLIQELTETEREDMAVRLEVQIQAARAGMEADTIRRTLDLIKEVADTLGDPDKPIVDSEGRKGCIPKLRDHLQRLPDLNIEGNPVLIQLRAEALAALDLNAENLRAHKGTRKRVSFMADNLHKKFQGSFGDRAITA